MNLHKLIKMKKKIKYETDTPVQGEMRKHALSALDKFQKIHEEDRKTMSDSEKIMDERMFNYYFDVGTIVELDEEVIPTDDDVFSPYPPNMKQHLGKEGIVKDYYSDLHAFGRGWSYHMDVEFGGELYKGLPAYFLIRKEK